ncbi:MAG: hydroxymethylglutaryl-CoA lyase [Pseudomonadota bacterium]|nr:hydroxymethylglutaryl-CoA lyase [Pseudomonadota bacterium]
MSREVRIVEVSLRDGLQHEKKILSVETRAKMVKKLVQAGVRHMELGAFVNPKWVPQMKGTAQLVAKIIKAQKKKTILPSVCFSALVPNDRGIIDAIETGIHEVAVFTAVSKTFALKNINCTPEQSLQRFESVLKLAKKNGVRVRGYISTCFGCPYEGKVSEKKVAELAEKLFELGVYEVSIGDTIGVATPLQVKSLLLTLFRVASPKKYALHFHDTRGTAVANILEGIKYGIRNFDSSLGGLGGCPFAKGAQGNVATEDILYMLHGMGFKTGIDLQKIISINHWLRKILGHSLPAKLSRAGIPSWLK